VISGTGDGSYLENAVVDILADTAPTGQSFFAWTGDTTGIADTAEPSTTITMPASDATIMATYENLYDLSVVSGTGDGSYIEGQVVNISADAPPPGQLFDVWTGNTTGIASTTTASTTITIQAADATITATYSLNSYTLDVVNGTGDGTYSASQVVNINADTAPTGQTFDVWTGDTTGITDTSAASTSITMPAADATITATYENLYSLSVTSGTGDGSYTSGAVVVINADAPATGMEFDDWEGGTTGIANVNAASTYITMPGANTTITATYLNVYDLAVVNGTGDGTYTNGQVVNIDADAAVTGQQFDQWTGDTTGIADVYASSTSITMPAVNATITATYDYISYTLTVISGLGDGSYTLDQVVDIAADAAPTGQTFDDWEGDTAGVASTTPARNHHARRSRGRHGHLRLR